MSCLYKIWLCQKFFCILCRNSSLLGCLMSPAKVSIFSTVNFFYNVIPGRNVCISWRNRMLLLTRMRITLLNSFPNSFKRKLLWRILLCMKSEKPMPVILNLFNNGTKMQKLNGSLFNCRMSSRFDLLVCNVNP